jgi:hypothetical protein
VKQYRKIIVALTFIAMSILTGITLMAPIVVYGQSRGGTALSQESRRDPFLLPSGVRLLSRIDAASETRAISSKADEKRGNIPDRLKVKAILISDYIRLALIDRHIVTVGDSIHEEKVLEIKADRVTLGKGNQKKTLLLSQSPVLLTVEERPHAVITPRKGGVKEGGKGE